MLTTPAPSVRLTKSELESISEAYDMLDTGELTKKLYKTLGELQTRGESVNIAGYISNTALIQELERRLEGDKSFPIKEISGQIDDNVLDRDKMVSELSVINRTLADSAEGIGVVDIKKFTVEITNNFRFIKQDDLRLQEDKEINYLTVAKNIENQLKELPSPNITKQEFTKIISSNLQQAYNALDKEEKEDKLESPSTSPSVGEFNKLVVVSKEIGGK